MFYKFIFNMLAVCAMILCAYYTSMFSKMNDDITELKDLVKSKCAASSAGAGSTKKSTKKPKSD